MPDLLRIAAVVSLIVGLVAAALTIYGAPDPTSLIDCERALGFRFDATATCENAAAVAQAALWGWAIGYGLSGAITFLILWTLADILASQDAQKAAIENILNFARAQHDRGRS